MEIRKKDDHRPDIRVQSSLGAYDLKKRGRAHKVNKGYGIEEVWGGENPRSQISKERMDRA